MTAMGDGDGCVGRKGSLSLYKLTEGRTKKTDKKPAKKKAAKKRS